MRQISIMNWRKLGRRPCTLKRDTNQEQWHLKHLLAYSTKWELMKQCKGNFSYSNIYMNIHLLNFQADTEKSGLSLQQTSKQSFSSLNLYLWLYRCNRLISCFYPPIVSQRYLHKSSHFKPLNLFLKLLMSFLSINSLTSNDVLYLFPKMHAL